MSNKSKQYPVPKFDNLEKEDKFWQSHSPLTEGYEGKIQRKKQNRASFLSIRLTGEELTYLREKAARYGLSPSTYARQVIMQAMEFDAGSLPANLLFSVFSYVLGKLTGEQQEKYYKQLNETCKEYLKTQNRFTQEIASICLPNLLNQIEEVEQIQRSGTKH